MSNPYNDKRLEFRKLFSVYGRVGRKDYLIVQVAGPVVFFVVLLIALWITMSLGLGEYEPKGLTRASKFDNSRNREDFRYWIALAIAGVPYLLAIICTSIKRLHDGGSSGWWMLFCWIPGINLLFLGYLVFVRGEEGTNRYGAVNSGSPFPMLHGECSTSRKEIGT